MGSLFDLIQLILQNIWLYGASFLLVLTILVFVHEWGHFIVARMCGVRVDVFSIGFGKEIWGRTAKNGTRWKFSMIPLGGYVKMYGDADPASAGTDDSVEYSEDDRKVAFFSQPVWKRSAIVFAGPAINFIFAIMILAGLFVFKGKVTSPPVVTAIQMEAPADIAGFQPHDLILEIDDREANRFEDIRRSVGIALDS
ncbi:MAG: M50 family metallopeptidase, partial [Bdellovibrionales bacterium]